jgi:TRAP-type C4-dicarboxylate transport system permease small subunit
MKKIKLIKNVLKAVFTILMIAGLCVGAMMVLKRMGFSKRKYLVVEEN